MGLFDKFLNALLKNGEKKTMQQTVGKQKNISAVLWELPRRKQIYEESVALMQKTNSPEVLYGRYIDVRDFMEWAAKLKAEGYPVNINQTESQAISQLNSFYNYHCVRIANHVAENSTTSKRYGILVEMLETLKDASNYDEAVAEITPLIESAKQAKEDKTKNSKNSADTINRGYRTSDCDTAQQSEDCVGIEVHRSNNCNEGCELCKAGAGKYPKGFNFTGWHPQCRCFITYVLKTDEEHRRDILTDTNGDSVNTVSKIPKSIKDYVSKHPECKSEEWYTSNIKYFK